MDTLLTGLLNFGIGGAMAGAVVYLVYHVMTRTIPELTQRHAAELDTQRTLYHGLLKSEHETFQAALAAVEARNTTAVEIITRNQEAIARIVEDNGVVLRDIHQAIARCPGRPPGERRETLEQ